MTIPAVPGPQGPAPADSALADAATFLERLTSHVAALGERAVLAAALLAPFLAAGWLAEALLRRAGRRVGAERQDVLNLLATTSKVALWTFGLVTALGTAGVNVSALVAGLGLTGFALGFALRDALSNLLAGVLLLAYRPFRRGDRIAVAGFEGLVTEIDLRYTTLQADGRRILIPNATLFTNTVVVHEPPDPRAAS